MTLEPINILEEANKLVHGERQGAYGHPADNWGLTANLWSLALGVPVSADKAVLCMILAKVARECHQHKLDSLVDIAGYCEVMNLILQKEKPAVV